MDNRALYCLDDSLGYFDEFLLSMCKICSGVRWKCVICGIESLEGFCHLGFEMPQCSKLVNGAHNSRWCSNCSSFQGIIVMVVDCQR